MVRVCKSKRKTTKTLSTLTLDFILVQNHIWNSLLDWEPTTGIRTYQSPFDNMNIENHQCNLPVYIDAKNRKYLLLSNIEDDVFYALLIK